MALAAPVATVPNLVVFGNSLSDNGNDVTLAASLGVSTDGIGYWHGRFTNSYVWNEYTAKILGLTLANKAYGGATTNNGPSPGSAFNMTIPSFHDQTVAWLAANPAPGQFHLEHDVIEVEIGGNDILNHAMELFAGTLSPAQLAAQVATSIASDVEALAAAGYRNINVWNLPAAELSPLIRSLGASAIIKPLLDMVNAAIAQSVGAVATKYNIQGAAHIRVIDLYGFILATLQPSVLAAIGVTDTTDACYVKDAAGNASICNNPDQHFFYDDNHPASRMHYLWGAAAAALIRNPETQLTPDFIVGLAAKYNIAQSDAQTNIIVCGTKCH
ncbi:hypothetical protein H4R19_000892 [Coemansia spiralis]|nr:hypothetical protein H4R19_000892 [Coemansia spiralis]